MATKEETEKHWRVQPTSLFREPYKRDPGVQIIHDPAEMREVIDAELSGTPAVTFRERNGATDVSDPLRRFQGLIRASRTLTSEEFRAKCEGVEDLMLHNALYGQMTDSQRGQRLEKLADIQFRRQQEALKQLNIIKKEEARKEDALKSSFAALRKQAARQAPKETSEVLVEPEAPKEADEE